MDNHTTFRNLFISFPVISLSTLVFVCCVYAILPATRSPIQLLPLPVSFPTFSLQRMTHRLIIPY